MADSLNPVPVPDYWVSLNSLGGVPVGMPFSIQNIGSPQDLVEIRVQDAEPAASDLGEIIKQFSPAYKIEAAESEVWARYKVISSKNISASTVNVAMRPMARAGSEYQKTAFGELKVAQDTPVIQDKATYGINLQKMRVIATGTGNVAEATTNGEYHCKPGSASGNFSTIFSRRSLAYLSGQGMKFPFTARFKNFTADRAGWAGPQNATDALAFGYLGTEFGIFYRHHGQQEIRALTFTDPAGGNEAATVTIDGTGYTVNLTAGTVEKNAAETAAQLNSSVSLWSFYQVGAVVIARSLLSQAYAGAFSFSSPGAAVAAFSTIATGNAVEEDFIYQNDQGDGSPYWNGADVSWLDTSKGNVFQVKVQYLGYGGIIFEIEHPETGEFITVHTLKNPNQLERPTLANPSLRIGWNVSNRGGGQADVYGASLAGMNEGQIILTEEGQTHSVSASVGSSRTHLFSIKNREVFDTKVNLGDILLDYVSASTESSKGITITFIRNADISGPEQNFTYKNESSSLALVDETAGLTITGGEELLTITLGPQGEKDRDITKRRLRLLPDDVLTVVAIQNAGGSASIVNLGLDFDQIL